MGETVKRIASSYVYYYNRKYGRDGHLFKERFKSEPVNDMAYFTVLLRYIHQNPVKAGIVKLVKDYEFSSWGEFDGTIDSAFQICDTQTILNRKPFKDLAEWVNEPLADDICCLDNDNETPRLRLSDDQVWQRIIQLTGVSCSSDFQKLERPVRQESYLDDKQFGSIYADCEELVKILTHRCKKLDEEAGK